MRSETLVLAVAISAMLMSPAAAYIDPGSGSVITTAIIGFFAAIAYTARKYFYRIKDLLPGRRASENEPR